MMDIQACRSHLDGRLKAKAARNRARWNRARQDADRLVAHIAASYGPDRIIQWGSVLDPDRFGPRSDIDIAVEGNFRPDAWFRLLGEAWGMTRFPVDIVDLGRIEPEFADVIRMKGKVVYERSDVAH